MVWLRETKHACALKWWPWPGDVLNLVNAIYYLIVLPKNYFNSGTHLCSITNNLSELACGANAGLTRN